ncbi:Nicotinamidase-related amidase [Rhizobiales bacterium GAS191]|jgi:nicotinamidase-related amidase|nr:Nicotinamidase-related amidase [Rhizobiales bacterium GAS113]SEE25116.1 Nicotinamidase-related amidase [Rhizobiales bacterium GAS191]SEE31401.1 Nicotinamidase-related amidase [Rhizobiales bacterium GAS188]
MTVPSPGGKGTALLVIDLQLGMFNGERIAPIHAGEMLLTRVQTLLLQARHSGTPIIYVRHAGQSGHLLEHGTPNWQIHPSIAPQSGEAIVDKRTPDSFHETTLMPVLTTAGVKSLVVVGAQTEVCVDTTCRRAFTLGFDVALVSDAHSTWDNDTLTADQIIRHTNQTLAGWFVHLVPAAEVGDCVQNF